MKTKVFYLSLPLLMMVFLAGCSKYGYAPETPASGESFADADGYSADFGEIVPGGSSSGSNNGQSEAGRVTAGEWRDLDNWLFWSDLMTKSNDNQEGEDYSSYSDYWKLYTNNRIAVVVTDVNQEPLADAKVTLTNAHGYPLWTARTDNSGRTNLWLGLIQKNDSYDASQLQLWLNDVKQDVEVSITRWGEEVKENQLVDYESSSISNLPMDIAFIVDATGSMGDEISFLKADLLNILNEVNDGRAIRTSALFYRDEGDEYVTRASDFDSNPSRTTAFINSQDAGGGGDYPEAVHTALEVGLNELSWNQDKSIRLAFMLLDAPPHKQDDVIKSLQSTIPQYAAKGIRIIPIAASGVDKPTEFFLRFTAIATDATYVFLTNDSGIGGDHIKATVGDYEVELLRDLMIRLIKQYSM